MGLGIAERESIARRAASEITSGMIVNLGIGIPSLVPDFLPAGMEVMLQAENGVLGSAVVRSAERRMSFYAMRPDFLSVQLRVLPILIQLCLLP